MARIKDYIVATRPWSFTMSLISITVGTLLAGEDGPVHWVWFAVVAMGIVCFHAAANVLNDYFDSRYRVDQPDAITAKLETAFGLLFIVGLILNEMISL